MNHLTQLGNPTTSIRLAVYRVCTKMIVVFLFWSLCMLGYTWGSYGGLKFTNKKIKQALPSFCFGSSDSSVTSKSFDIFDR